MELEILGAIDFGKKYVNPIDGWQKDGFNYDVFIANSLQIRKNLCKGDQLYLTHFLPTVFWDF